MEKDDIAKFRMVAIGGSAGSLEIILKIITTLPDNTGASFIIIIHRMQSPDSLLESLLSSKTTLPVKEVEDKESIRKGNIYIAPADYHLLLENETLFSLDTSERVNFCRPSIDVTFQSASEIFGPSLIGVLLSGANSDGALGLQTISRNGGYTIVQDPAKAEVSYMPEQAIKIAKVNEIADGDQIGFLLNNLLSSR
jgi:two-component system chemotaxis response regulator CheB